MSQNSSANPTDKPRRHYRWWWAVGLVFWVLAGFVVSQLIVLGIFWLLAQFHVPTNALNSAISNTITAALIYALTCVLVIGLPWWLKKRRTTWEDLGLSRLPTWTDIGLGPAGFIVYIVISSIILFLFTQFVPWFDGNQLQSVGFEHLVYRYEYILAFIVLVVVAPLIEEILFRGYLYGRLRKIIPIWVAILFTSVLFGFIHGQWNVAVDVFVLSVVMCSLREVTGNIWAGVLVHMMKNGVAFYFLFINPSLLHTIGG